MDNKAPLINVEKVSDVITEQDFAGQIISWNKAAEALYGWTEKEVANLHVSELIAEKDRHAYAAMIRRLQAGKPVEPFTISRIAKSGKLMIVSLQATAVLDDNGLPVGFKTVEMLADETPDGQ